MLALHSRLADAGQGYITVGVSLENGAVLDPTNQPWRYITCRGSRRRRPQTTEVSMEMLSPELTQTRNSFADLDSEVPLPSSLVASQSRSDAEVPASSSSVLFPSPVASLYTSMMSLLLLVILCSTSTETTPFCILLALLWTLC